MQNSPGLWGGRRITRVAREGTIPVTEPVVEESVVPKKSVVKRRVHSRERSDVYGNHVEDPWDIMTHVSGNRY